MLFISPIQMRLGIVLAAFTLSACSAGQSFTHLDPTRDMGARPGLLSGEKGYFEYTIHKPLKEVEAEEADELFLPFEDY